jgi:hypothetical protein
MVNFVREEGRKGGKVNEAAKKKKETVEFFRNIQN